ncbi:MAG: penicillin-binding protein activator LpoB [Spirochaetaceae bacterium]|jgi:PBP1b-binding outer membrane lipoprotein LpoB|nr:penicillin-binding protein activator LpoB [Spirochaetaceae bacterium]
MKHFSVKKILLNVIVAAIPVILLVSCSFILKVTRADRQADSSGYWNDNDVRQLCAGLIKNCVDSTNVVRFVNLYAQTHRGKQPAAMVFPFKNASSGHIDMQIISNSLRSSIIDSGKLDFVEDGAARNAISAEYTDQNNDNASEETAADMERKAEGALAFTGEVRSIIDTAGKSPTRVYFIKATLTNMETDRILWEGEDTVRKKIKRPQDLIEKAHR